ncbi:MAG: peptidoglycan-associated lipoprotein Pal [Proteobacteria bacterium]|nr:peptidoglycan-associated lipoprotein Pal [Pseudomonadota bacterium]MBU2228530.1 peptidoglycan-associated lipoprotein Pal [Pseudomonadota bacterium]MBU2262206.1 peptidoglycan-associated lipoprotein Pal [Pseudomonadota bacterium]
MKKNLLSIGLIVLALCISVTYLTGCAKKAAVKEQVTVTQEREPAVVAPPVVPPAVKPVDDAAARERALREQALRDQAAREAAAKEAKEAAERAKKEAAARAAALLKELTIPDIHFDFDKYNLKPEAQAILKAGAPAYLKHKEYKLVVEGHCDERGTAEYNLALGQRRADEAAKYLVDLGIQKDRINTISYGEEMPLDKGQNEEAWAKNRRAHFVTFPPVK